MARIEELIGLIHEGQLTLTDEQLLAEYGECFNLEKKLISEGLLKASKEPKTKSEEPIPVVRPKKISRHQKMMNELMELQKQLTAKTT